MKTPEVLVQLELSKQLSTGSEITLAIGRSWLETCSSNHPECRPLYDGEHWLPTRLLSVGTRKSPELRLVLRQSLTDDTGYATISHCWGQSKCPTLTKALIDDYLMNVPTAGLSKTIQDAIDVTRHLGLRYLWVDCLCIIQNDSEDWQTESTTMSMVYGHSTCTIAAACATNGDAGLWQERNPLRIRPLKIPNPFNPKASLVFQISSQYLGPIHQKDVAQSVWHGRSWVYQARLLSQRMLILGPKQILWACQRIQAAESCPRGKTSDNYIDRFESFEIGKLRLRSMLDDQAVRKDDRPEAPWQVIVSEYTQTVTTRKSDRLVALQGIAERIMLKRGHSYWYGIWLDESLPWDLTWYVSPEKISPQPEDYRCPSWSWASIDGEVSFHAFKNISSVCYVEHFDKVEEYLDTASNIDQHGPSLEVEAPLVEAFLEVEMAEKTIVMLREKVNVIKEKAILLGDVTTNDSATVSMNVNTDDPLHRSKCFVLLLQITHSLLHYLSVGYEFFCKGSKAILIDIAVVLLVLWWPIHLLGALLWGEDWEEDAVNAVKTFMKDSVLPHAQRELEEEPKQYKTQSMQTGTAYGIDTMDGGFMMKIDPIVKATGYMDSISLSDGIISVRGLVLVGQKSKPEIHGLLLLAVSPHVSQALVWARVRFRSS